MPSFFATFTPGFEDAVERLFREDMPGCSIERVYSGAVHYKRRGDLLHPPWMGNTYLCLMSFGRVKGDPFREMVRLSLTRGVDTETLARYLPADAAKFRVLFMQDNAIGHVGPKTLEPAEEFLENSSGLLRTRVQPDVEFWYIYRSADGVGFLLMRLTQSQRRKSKPGELRTDTASLLCRLSNPRHGMVFFDPYADAGSIAGAALGYDFAVIRAADQNVGKVAALSTRFANAARAEAFRDDPLNPKVQPAGSVDALVTHYTDGPEQAKPFAAAARSLMKKEAMLVAMQQCPQEMRRALGRDFIVLEEYEATVAGTVYSVLCASKK